MNETALEREGRSTVNSLRQGGRADLPEELEALLDQTRDPGVRDEALGAIAQRCHPKWLGDVYVEGVGWPSWWDRLSRLGTAAERALRLGTN